MVQLVIIIGFGLSAPLFSRSGLETNLNTPDCEVTKTHSSFYGFVIDSEQSARSGAENIFSLHQFLSAIEDSLFSSTRTPFIHRQNTISGPTSRLLKFILLDMPKDFFLILINHEYYGHASRYREFDLGHIDYHYEAPFPYGEGAGYAHVSNYPRSLSDQERIVMWESGWEAHDLLNQRIRMEWMARGKAYYHETSLYLWSWQDRFQYIQWEHDDLPSNLTGSLYDPEGYVWFLNRSAGYNDPENLKFTISDLRRSAQIGLLDPFVWYSIYTSFVKYIYAGEQKSALPLINLAGFKYLPGIRMSFTPFGPQYHFENYLKWKSIVSLLDITIGDHVFYKNWWGCGLKINNLKIMPNLPLDVNLNVWNQPEFTIGNNNNNPISKGIGFAASLRGMYTVPNDVFSLKFIGEVGFKSPGFIQGYPIESTPIILFGLGISSL